MPKRSRLTGYDATRAHRENFLRLALSGLMALAVVVLIFWAAFALFPLTARLPQTVSSGGAVSPLDWDLLGSITSVGTLALLVGGLVFAVSEYIQNAVQRRREAAQAEFGMYKEVFDRLMCSEATAARRWIILNLPTLDQANNDKEAWLARIEKLLCEAPEGVHEHCPGREYLKQVLNTLDFVGFVARHYWSMENELVEWMSGPVAKVWERIYLYVEREAEERAEPDFYQSARWLGQRCLEWRRAHYRRSQIIRHAT